jgi:hypothetical protein
MVLPQIADDWEVVMKVRRRVTRAMVAMALATSVIPLWGLPAAATSAPEVLATGLNAPYKLSQGPDGAFYVAEAGTGGAKCITVTGPEGDEVQACSGPTGSVSRVAAGGNSRVATD